MMYLFEIETGWIGESYERSYVWADSEDNAVKLFLSKYDRDVKSISVLFGSDAKPFATKPSGSGFDL